MEHGEINRKHGDHMPYKPHTLLNLCFIENFSLYGYLGRYFVEINPPLHNHIYCLIGKTQQLHNK